VGTRPSTPGAGTRPSTPGVGTRPSTPGAGTRPSTGGRPSQQDLKNFLDLPSGGSGTRPGAPSTQPVPGGGAAADFLQNRPPTAGQLPARPGDGERPGIGDRPGAGERPGAGTRPGAENRQDRRERISDNRAGRIDNRDQWRDNRNARRDYVHDHMKRYPLRRDFWQGHPYWARWAWTRPYRWATWAAVTGWFAWPRANTYAYGENVYYQDNSVYYGEDVVATSDQYAQQAYDITEAAPAVSEDDEWMQLGVYAITQDGEASGAPPTMFLQLAVSKTGVIAGMFFDQTSDESMEIEGAIDKKSQRTAWVGKGMKWPIMETGISNLTEEAAPALVHFEDGQTQQVLLVRLDDPKGEAATQ
jgi:hypothetical protein